MLITPAGFRRRYRLTGRKSSRSNLADRARQLCVLYIRILCREIIKFPSDISYIRDTFAPPSGLISPTSHAHFVAVKIKILISYQRPDLRLSGEYNRDFTLEVLQLRAKDSRVRSKRSLLWHNPGTLHRNVISSVERWRGGEGDCSPLAASRRDVTDGRSINVCLPRMIHFGDGAIYGRIISFHV